MLDEQDIQCGVPCHNAVFDNFRDHCIYKRGFRGLRRVLLLHMDIVTGFLYPRVVGSPQLCL